TKADRVGDVDKHDRNRTSFPLQCNCHCARICEDHIGVQGDQLFREYLSAPRANSCEPIFEVNISAFRPSASFKAMPEHRSARLRFWLILFEVHEHADAPHVLLLRPRRERPRGRRAADKRDELAPLHSITSSAIASSLSGMVRPSALAVLRFRNIWTFVDC